MNIKSILCKVFRKFVKRKKIIVYILSSLFMTCDFLSQKRKDYYYFLHKEYLQGK